MRYKIISSTFIVIILLLITNSNAQYKINPSDFINYSEQIFDVLDKVEAVFLNTDSTKRDAKIAIFELDAAIRKYDRLGDKEWKDKLPQKIRTSIISARLNYDIFLMTGEKEKFDEAHKSANVARKDFQRYKTNHRK